MDSLDESPHCLAGTLLSPCFRGPLLKLNCCILRDLYACKSFSVGQEIIPQHDGTKVGAVFADPSDDVSSIKAVLEACCLFLVLPSLAAYTGCDMQFPAAGPQKACDTPSCPIQRAKAS